MIGHGLLGGQTGARAQGEHLAWEREMRSRCVGVGVGRGGRVFEVGLAVGGEGGGGGGCGGGGVDGLAAALTPPPP